MLRQPISGTAFCVLLAVEGDSSYLLLTAKLIMQSLTLPQSYKPNLNLVIKQWLNENAVKMEKK